MPQSMQEKLDILGVSHGKAASWIQVSEKKIKEWADGEPPVKFMIMLDGLIVQHNKHIALKDKI